LESLAYPVLLPDIAITSVRMRDSSRLFNKAMSESKARYYLLDYIS